MKYFISMIASKILLWRGVRQILFFASTPKKKTGPSVFPPQCISSGVIHSLNVATSFCASFIYQNIKIPTIFERKVALVRDRPGRLLTRNVISPPNYTETLPFRK
jgi:hypothetical protein